jgi:hypothetical protein
MVVKPREIDRLLEHQIRNLAAGQPVEGARYVRKPGNLYG